MDWRYSDSPHAAVFTSRRVLEQDAAVVRVVRDDEGDWQALDAEPRAQGEARISALEALLDLHPDVEEAVAALDAYGRGWQAVRDPENRWTVVPHTLD